MESYSAGGKHIFEQVFKDGRETKRYSNFALALYVNNLNYNTYSRKSFPIDLGDSIINKCRVHRGTAYNYVVDFISRSLKSHTLNGNFNIELTDEYGNIITLKFSYSNGTFKVHHYSAQNKNGVSLRTCVGIDSIEKALNG